MNAEFIEPAWHEFVVNLVFDDRGACCQHGLEPFYAAEKIIRSSQRSSVAVRAQDAHAERPLRVRKNSWARFNCDCLYIERKRKEKRFHRNSQSVTKMAC